MERGKWEVEVLEVEELFSEEEVKLLEKRMRRRQTCMPAPGCIVNISISSRGCAYEWKPRSATLLPLYPGVSRKVLEC